MEYKINKNLIDISTTEDDNVSINSENITTVVKHNDTGVSIDVYYGDTLTHSVAHWFDELY